MAISVRCCKFLKWQLLSVFFLFPSLYLRGHCFKCKTIFRSPGIIQCQLKQKHFIFRIWMNLCWSKQQPTRSKAWEMKIVCFWSNRRIIICCCRIIDPVGEMLFLLLLLFNLFNLFGVMQHSFSFCFSFLLFLISITLFHGLQMDVMFLIVAHLVSCYRYMTSSTKHLFCFWWNDN